MADLFQFTKYWNTVRYLKPVQVYGRLWFKIHRPKPDLRPSPQLRIQKGTWNDGIRKRQSMFGPSHFRFLNEEHELSSSFDWNNPSWDKLWLYNLHYFDDLNAVGAEHRREWQLASMRRWILENPPGFGNGWEPYPTSLRIVNWIKWSLKGEVLPEDVARSLAVQTRFLRDRLEYHLLGNHFFANVKALVFAGLFFSNLEAERWLKKGLCSLAHEIPEQVLTDGGHFERSPMYHSTVLEDLLDLINLTSVYSAALPGDWRKTLDEWKKTARRMLFWLKVMSHPDGDIVLFNDAALGTAPPWGELEAYAGRLSISPVSGTGPALVHLPDTGYVRVRNGPAIAFCDVGPCGPDYLPGHAHADTLTFELSIHGQRVVVDSGTSCYGNGPDRIRQRSTAAHNTVTIDRRDSSETWGGFRVARRARPFDLEVCNRGEEIAISCSHDGYARLPGRPVHRRQWDFRKNELSIKDTISGVFSEATARLHFHPDIGIKLVGPGRISADLPSGRKLDLGFAGGIGDLKCSTYHPGFGKTLENKCLEIKFTSPELHTIFKWA